MKYDVGVSQWHGRRASQQDAVHAQYWRESTVLAVLADGMGGAAGGDIASRAAVAAVVERIEPRHEALGDHYLALAGAANNAIAQHIRNDERLRGMGTTLVILLVDDGRMHWFSVGDSPLWLYRDGNLHRKNLDESYGAHLDHLVAEGRMDVEAARNDQRRGQLFNVLLGAEELVVKDVDGSCALAAGDVIILASDGLQTLDDERIAATITANSAAPAEALTRHLLRAVAEEHAPHQDNASIILVKILNGIEAENEEELET